MKLFWNKLWIIVKPSMSKWQHSDNKVSTKYSSRFKVKLLLRVINSEEFLFKNVEINYYQSKRTRFILIRRKTLANFFLHFQVILIKVRSLVLANFCPWGLPVSGCRSSCSTSALLADSLAATSRLCTPGCSAADPETLEPLTQTLSRAGRRCQDLGMSLAGCVWWSSSSTSA